MRGINVIIIIIIIIITLVLKDGGAPIADIIFTKILGSNSSIFLLKNIFIQRIVVVPEIKHKMQIRFKSFNNK